MAKDSTNNDKELFRVEFGVYADICKVSYVSIRDIDVFDQQIAITINNVGNGSN